ncbi:hypothetical protein [Mucilaginibacter psychrotolerans]|uniref:Uncharacterized protein n=1 Tax=Mucilaginibacter psychrotolerans TaxID=1524096 RepID=A0A4Y8SJM5_9SPHI|nr:hypothetical protein [Mucilaginibacter psychrotolerans]TFF38850.1 hypothetical protein E2R66_07550 [Mucilaginibacter psychrotolerans]
MTTLTISIPDDSSDIISDITSLVKNAGGEISISSDEGLSEQEMDLLKSSYKEALLIKDGKLKGIPASELWND